MKITFNQFKKLLKESNDFRFDKYEDILCEVFNVDNIFEITKEDYSRIKDEYKNGTLNESDATLLEQAEELVIHSAIENGYNLIAHHGTPKEFSEFKYGDIGFHLGTLNQAKIAGSAHVSSTSVYYYNIIFLNTSISLHNPLVIEDDFESWYPKDIVHDALIELDHRYASSVKQLFDTYFSFLYTKDIANDVESINYIEERIKEDGLEYDHNGGEVSRLAFLYKDLKFSIKDIFEMNNHNLSEKVVKDIIVKRLKSFGYDGIKYKNLYEIDENTPSEYSYIVFDPNQIKNCEVVSFINNKVVPLEERFNSNSNNLFETNE